MLSEDGLQLGDEILAGLEDVFVGGKRHCCVLFEEATICLFNVKCFASRLEGFFLGSMPLLYMSSADYSGVALIACIDIRLKGLLYLLHGHGKSR